MVARTQTLPRFAQYFADRLRKGEPCPVEAVGKCNGNCRQPNGIKHQNQRITELAALLPVTDWGKAHEIEITETDPLTGNSITLLFRAAARWHCLMEAGISTAACLS